MPKKIKIRDKYWDENQPNRDFDFIEAFLSQEQSDNYINSHAARVANNLVDHKKLDQMRDQIYQAAAACLTDRQFQIFILRYKFGFLEVEIARQIEVIQPYVSNTLKVCHKKIRRYLNLEVKAKRGPRRAKNASKKQSKTTS